MLKDDVISFLKINQFIDDDDLQSFADDNDYDIDDVKSEVYQLACRFVKFMTSGRASEECISVDDVDPEQLGKGIEFESEHTDDEDIQRKLALDSIASNELYYEYLEYMKRQLSDDQEEQ